MFSAAYKRYAIIAITSLYTFVAIDRGLMVMLLQPMKDDLRLSDTQLGFLTGIAFGLFYATLGVPIARWADRGNRVTISSIALGLLGIVAMTYLFVTNFLQVVVLRIAAAVGDAGCKPPAYSLMGDYFPEPAERARAMYIYDAAAPVAALVSFAAAGWLNEHFGWRMTFFLVGIPALLLAALFKWTIVEPRGHASRAHQPTPPALPMREVLSTMWRQRACRHVTIAIALSFCGPGSWTVAFLMRSHDMGSAEVGVWIAGLIILSSTVGLLLGGFVVGRWFSQHGQPLLRLCAVIMALTVPFMVAYLTMRNKYLALGALTCAWALMNFFTPALFALLLRLVPNVMHATVLAAVFLFANLLGIGVAPQLVGMLSDLLTPTFGIDGLRYAMLIASLIGLWAAFHLLRASDTVDEDLVSVTAYAQPDPPSTDVSASYAK